MLSVTEIIDACTKGGACDGARVKEFVNVRENVLNEQRIFAKLRKRHADEMEQAIAIMDDIRAKCPHIMKFFPDASGNSDSESICLICDYRE